jgi:carbon monoxide dehydrogenase subunit G
MTLKVELETRIGRSPAAVFAELVALDRYPQWLIATGVTAIEVLDPGPLRAGTRLRIAQSVAGRATTLVGSVTALEPDRQLALQAKDREGIKVGIRAAVEPDGASTLLRWSLRADLPLRYRMFEGMVAPQARRAAALDIESFKRRLESVAED